MIRFNTQVTSLFVGIIVLCILFPSTDGRATVAGRLAALQKSEETSSNYSKPTSAESLHEESSLHSRKGKSKATILSPHDNRDQGVLKTEFSETNDDGNKTKGSKPEKTFFATTHEDSARVKHMHDVAVRNGLSYVLLAFYVICLIALLSVFYLTRKQVRMVLS